jgi:hypothetical protein
MLHPYGRTWYSVSKMRCVRPLNYFVVLSQFVIFFFEISKSNILHRCNCTGRMCGSGRARARTRVAIDSFLIRSFTVHASHTWVVSEKLATPSLSLSMLRTDFFSRNCGHPLGSFLIFYRISAEFSSVISWHFKLSVIFISKDSELRLMHSNKLLLFFSAG